MNRIPEQIIDAMFDRTCLFFIGSGMSVEAGLPSSQQLVDILTTKLKQSGNTPTGKKLLEVAQDFCRVFSRPELIQLIRCEIVKKLETADRSSFNLLSLLEIKPRDIVTTNWDPLIEEAIGKKNYMPIFEPKSVANYSDTLINLFKIHGDIDHDIVVTEEDYRGYKDNWGPVIIKLQSLFQERTVIFIGYSTDDEDFLDAYMEVYNRLGRKYLLPCYSVEPNLDEIKIQKLQERGVKPIQMTAREFLEKLHKSLQERLLKNGYKLPSPKTLPAPPPGDNNPFSIFRAEDITNEKWINETFVTPIDFAKIESPGNVIVEGHRGSGKSIILQYLSYPCAVERNSSINYVGFYVKLQQSYIHTIKRKKDEIEMEKEKWKEYFLHYFNLILGESILITLKHLIEKNKIKLTNEKEFVQRTLLRFFSHLPQQKSVAVTNISLLHDIFINERNRCAKFPPPDDFRLSPHFIYDFIELLQDYVKEWKDKFFYILLDEYDNLDDDQQKTINLYIADRGAPLRYRVSFKVAVKSFEMNYVTIDEKPLDPIDDYEWIPLDKFDKSDEEEFKKKLIEIANGRLKFYKYENSSVKEIFPSEGKGFEQGDYSGIENMLVLSSFLVRDFLELAKDMLYYAFPWIVSEKRNKIPAVPPYMQNFVIKVHSYILYGQRIDQIPGKIGGKEIKELSHLLIDRLGLIFQRILRGSKSKEKRTVSSFQLREDYNLNEFAKASLKGCREAGVLQVPFMVRTPQNYARYAPHKKYEFHRLLCPVFRLSLARRWPKEISSDLFNRIFESPDEVIEEITSYFSRNILIEEIKELPEAIELRKIYQEICKKECYERELFGKLGEVSIEKELFGFLLKMGEQTIKCNDESEAEYLKVFAEMGLKTIKIPKEQNLLKEIIPRFQEYKEKVNNAIQSKLEEYPSIKKNANREIPTVYQEILTENNTNE